MRTRLLHIATVLIIVYAATFYGMVEHIPLMRIIHQVGAALIFGSWMIALWRSRRGWPATPLDGPLWLLLGTAILSAALSRDPRVSLEYTWNYFVLLLMFYAFVDLIRQGRFRWILEGLFLFAGVLVLVTGVEMLAWYFGWPLVPGFVVGWPEIMGLSLPPVWHHASLLLNNENLTAAYGVLLLPITLGWALTSSRRDTRIGLGMLAGGLLLTTLFTQSRGALLAVAVMAAATAGWAASAWLLPRVLPARSPLQRSPYVFVAGLILVSALATAGIGFITAYSATEIDRSDMWLSAIRIFEDHPILGAGPHQFGPTRYWYPNWLHSVGLDGFDHAHNLTLHLLAEGGVLTFGLVVWLVVRSLRLWWNDWHRASRTTQYRLQAIAVMAAGFAAHNVVDSFLSLRPFMIVLAMLAAVAAPAYAISAATAMTRPRRAGVLLPLSAAALMIAQLTFVPLHLGQMKRQEALRLAQDRQYENALAALRAAQRLDPAFDLYVLEEAFTLGLAAAEHPDRYLNPAILAHQEALARNPVWDVGWNNLASLFAEKKEFAAAVEAGQRATHRQPTMAEYRFQLGLHQTAHGETEQARTEFFRAFELHPALAASDYWTDPAHPERKTIRGAAIQHFADRPETGTDIAMYGGQTELAARLHETIAKFSSDAIQMRYEAAWDDACLPCFYIPANSYLIRAQSMLHRGADVEDGRRAKASARTALFVSEGQLVWANYILAQLKHNADKEVDNLLFQAVPAPHNEEPRFSIVFYGLSSPITTLPQARSPVQSRYEYEPWLVLGERLQTARDFDTALSVYRRILERDPYDRTAQRQIEAITQAQASSELQ